MRVASVDECRNALHDLAKRLSENAEARGKLDLDRTLACRLTDLETAFHARLVGGELVDIADGDDPNAKIAMIMASDDLLALVRGELDVMGAVASRRVSIKANPFDLLKLRKLL
jgi:putative sterol carrier protein